MITIKLYNLCLNTLNKFNNYTRWLFGSTTLYVNHTLYCSLISKEFSLPQLLKEQSCCPTAAPLVVSLWQFYLYPLESLP